MTRPPGNTTAVDGPGGLQLPTPVLEELEAHGLEVARTLERVEQRLADQVVSSHAFVDTAARYLMEAGGKRFRPLLVALTGHLGGAGDGPVADPVAGASDPAAGVSDPAAGVSDPAAGASDPAAGASDPAAGASDPVADISDPVADAGVVVELVHLATLYHDDVIDEAAARRGAPSANLRWDNTVAILTGDYLFARASALSAELGVEVTRIMSRTIATLCEGQIREIQGSAGALPRDLPGLEPTLDHYLTVVSEKTASLIATSCRLGAWLSGCDDAEVEAAARYGWNVGMAFQLSDDILDIASDHDDSGKIPGTDLREGVRTLPILYAARDAAEAGDEELVELIERGPELDDAEIADVLARLRDGDALARARETAAGYVDDAVAELDRFGDRAATHALRRLGRYAVDRVG